MKKIFLFLCAFLLICPLSAQTFNVLIGKTKTANISFLEDYSVVIDDHYYGPFSKETSLKAEMFGAKAIRFWIKYEEDGEKRIRDFGYTQSKIKIVRAFRDGIFSDNIVSPEKAKSKKMPRKGIELAKEAQKTTPFFRYKNPALSDWIEFSGPLTLMTRAQSTTKFYLIETIPLEPYLINVTNCEMRVANNIEAYKAQSILARTFVLNKVNERLNTKNGAFRNWLDFQFLPDERDQAYICEMRVKNRTLPSEAVKNAVKATANKILLDKNNNPIEVHYCAYCGECSYCTLNKRCKTENGMGSCQNGIAYYTAKKGYNYEQVLKKYHPNAKIGDFSVNMLKLAETIQDREELENNLSQAENRLKQMI